MHLVLGISIFLSLSAKDSLVKAPLTWFWYCTKPRGIGSQPCSYLSLLIPGEKTVLCWYNNQSFTGKTWGNSLKLLSGQIVVPSVPRHMQMNIVNDSITVKKKREFITKFLGKERAVVCILAVWAKHKGLQAAILQSVNRRKDRRVKCQPVNLPEEDGWNYQ